MKDDGTDMTDQEVDTEASKHNLTPQQIGLVQQRKGHARKYYLSQTIAALTSGTLQPQTPKANAGTRTMTRREAAGLTNPSHTAPSVRPLFLNAAVSPQPSNRSEEDWLFSPSRHFEVHTPTHTQPPQIVQGHSNTVMGHGGPGREDAVDYWNRVGHTLPRQQNSAHNRQASIYHGLESKQRSAQSGGQTTSRYLSPNPTRGSHPSYYDTTHQDFNPNVPWTQYVPNQYGSMAPLMSALPSQTSTAPPQSSTQAPTPLPVIPPLTLTPPMLSQPQLSTQPPTAPSSTSQPQQQLPSFQSLLSGINLPQTPSTHTHNTSQTQQQLPSFQSLLQSLGSQTHTPSNTQPGPSNSSPSNDDAMDL